jgi:N-acylneuraminate cytidylyltransferase
VVLLQPTSPFRNADDIERCIATRRGAGAAACVSIAECDCHPAWSFTLSDRGRLRALSERPLPARRQSLSAVYRPNGAVYVVDADVLRRGGSWWGDDTVGHLMPEQRSLDIDAPWDLHLARLLVADFVSAAK